MIGLAARVSDLTEGLAGTRGGGGVVLLSDVKNDQCICGHCTAVHCVCGRCRDLSIGRLSRGDKC